MYTEISKQFYKSAKDYGEFKKQFKNLFVGGDWSGTRCILSDRKDHREPRDGQPFTVTRSHHRHSSLFKERPLRDHKIGHINLIGTAIQSHIHTHTVLEVSISAEGRGGEGPRSQRFFLFFICGH